MLEAIERLAGAPVPASALETLVLPGRVPGYSPALIDELTAAGEVVWAGAGSVGSGDGWLVLAPAESAPLLLPEPAELTMTPLHGALLTALAGGGGMFFRMLSDRVAAVLDGHPADDGDLVAALWDLAWAGLVTNDTLAPLRVVTSGGTTVRRPAAPRRATGSSLAADLGGIATDRGYGSGGRGTPGGTGLGGSRAGGSMPGVFNPRPAVRGGTGFAGGYAGSGRYGRGTRRSAMPTRTGPPTVSGRWSLLPERYGLPAAGDVPGADSLPGGPPGGTDPGAATMRAHAVALTLLERHGVVTKGAVAAERIPGGFAAVYPVLRAMEETGQCRRGYFVEGLGGAQFALPGAVERLRAAASGEDQTLVVAAVDPAQPYGAALAWPPKDIRTPRTAGAYVAISGGDPVLYLERGGRALHTLIEPEDPRLHSAVMALVDQVRTGRIKRLALEKIDGEPALTSPLAAELVELGFQGGPRRLTLSA